MILDEIVADKREQLFRDKQKTDLTVMRTLAEEKLREEAAKKENVRSFYQNLAKDGLSIIGEFKNASPSLGKIESRITLEERNGRLYRFCGCGILPDRREAFPWKY